MDKHKSGELRCPATAPIVIVTLGFAGVYIIIIIIIIIFLFYLFIFFFFIFYLFIFFYLFDPKHRVWVLVRSAQARRFKLLPTFYVFSKTIKDVKNVENSFLFVCLFVLI